MDHMYSGYGSAFLASPAPLYPSELNDMEITPSDSNSYATSSSPVSKSASPIFNFYNSTAATTNITEAEEPSSTLSRTKMSGSVQSIYLIDFPPSTYSPAALSTMYRKVKTPPDTHRAMSQSIYLIDFPPSTHSPAALSTMYRKVKTPPDTHRAMSQSIYLIDFPPSISYNTTTAGKVKAPSITSFSRYAVSGPAQVTDIISSPIVTFYNSAAVASSISENVMSDPARSAESITFPAFPSYNSTTTLDEINTPYTNPFSRCAASGTITSPISTFYNSATVTTEDQALFGAMPAPTQSPEFITSPTSPSYSPVITTTPLTYHTISGPPQIPEVIDSPVFTFYDSTAVGTNFHTLSNTPLTMSRFGQIGVFDQGCETEDEIMEYDDGGEDEEIKSGEDEIMEDYDNEERDWMVEQDTMVEEKIEEEHTWYEGEKRMVVEEDIREDEDRMIEDEDRKIEEVDDGEEEIDQSEEESEEENEESEESEESEEGSEEESEESEEESEGSEEESEESEEESEGEIKESEEIKGSEGDSSAKEEDRYGNLEVWRAVIEGRNGNVEDGKDEDLMMEDSKIEVEDSEVKDRNIEESGIEEGNWNGEMSYKVQEEIGENEGESGKIVAEETMAREDSKTREEYSKAEENEIKEERLGREESPEEISEREREIVEGEGEENTAELVEQYQVEVEDEEVEKSEIATTAQLATRRIAPLRRRLPNILAAPASAVLVLALSTLSTPTPVGGGEEVNEEWRRGWDRGGDSDESLSDPESDSGDEALGWAGKVAVAERKPETGVEASWLSEMAVEIPFSGPIVPSPNSISTSTLNSYPSASTNEGGPYESLSEPDSGKDNEALSWALPDSEKEDTGDKEKGPPTSVSTPISFPARTTTAATTVWNPSSAFVYNLAFAPASFEARPRPHPMVITGRWVRKHRGSWKDYIWVAEDSTAEPRGGEEVEEDKKKVEENIPVRTEEEEEAVRAEVFHADMARVRERGWSWGGGEVLVEEATTTTRTAAPTEHTEVIMREVTSSTVVGSPSSDPTELDLIVVSTGRRIGPLLLMLPVAVALLAWVLVFRQSFAGHVFWDGLWVVPGAPAWELIAPFETMLFKVVWQVLPMNIGTIVLALFLSVVLTDVWAAAQQQGAKKSLGRLFRWTAGAVGGVGVAIQAVMRWRTALKIITPESKMAFTLPRLVTNAEWEEVRIIGVKKSLPIKFVLAGDVVPTAEMCPRHELGIGAGIGASGSGAGSSFGLGLFLLGFLVWGSGGRQLRSVGRV